MTTTLRRLFLPLAMAASLALVAPVPAAAEDAPSSDAVLAQARALHDAGRFDEALAVLRPLMAERTVDANTAFFFALTAIEASRQGAKPDAERKALLDEAIAALRAMLVQRPDLVRVRLELARAFFQNGEDGLARQHFELVLAGDVPAAVKANVRGFLSRIRARRRWTAYLGGAIAPDSNITGVSGVVGLPIELSGGQVLEFSDTGQIETSGVGVHIWTGGEYQHPLGDRLRLRAGANASRREHKQGKFDEMNAGVHLGPRWLIDGRTEASLLGSLRRSWYAGRISYDAPGARLEVRRRLTARVLGNARASWERRSYRDRQNSNGPVTALSLNGTWTITPVLRANALIGYGRERPESPGARNTSRRLGAGLSAILPRGFNVSVSGQLRETDYQGNFNFNSDTPRREDLTRTLTASVFKRDFTLFGFAPQLAVTREVRRSTGRRGTGEGVPVFDYDRNRAEIRFVHQF